MLLESIHSPADVRALPDGQLPQLCQELREFLVGSVSETGGHLASNLGAVELTVAIHRVFDTSADRLVFDVGHQCYVHKALTGRRELFSTLRQFGGHKKFSGIKEGGKYGNWRNCDLLWFSSAVLLSWCIPQGKEKISKQEEKK